MTVRTLASIHAVAGLHSRGGGTSRVVTSLTDHLAVIGNTKVSIISQSIAGGDCLESHASSVKRLIGTSSNAISINLGLPFLAQLINARLGDDITVLHNHGVWHAVNHWTSVAARRLGLPIIIQPHGMLEPWALDHNGIKKKVALHLYQRKDLKSATAFLATSEMEYVNLRELGITQPVAIIPNGVDCDLSVAEQRSPVATRRSRVALFLSRIHPKKGVLELVRAWANVRPPGWRLEIVGPSEGGHLEEVIAEAGRLGVASSIAFLPEVQGNKKSEAYRRADLFILPTYSENFGLVVAEALVYGLPVITTRGAPWADLETHSCGWWIKPDQPSLDAALRTATVLCDEDRVAMGRRGQVYVQRYKWEAIAPKVLEFYQWSLQQCERPAFVYLD